MIAPCDPPNANQTTLNICLVFICCWLDLKCYITTFKMKNALCLLLLSFSLQREFFYMSIISSGVNRFQIKSVFSIFFSGIKCQSMESIESTAVKKPGETLTLSCRGSGFSFSCCSMHWIRQQAGKPLVWMGRVYSHGSGNDYSESFKGRAEITRDNSKSTVYLKLTGLTAEDSAMYYCAKQAQWHKSLVQLNKNHTGCFISLLEVNRWQQRIKNQ